MGRAWIVYENAKLKMKIKVTKLVFRGMWIGKMVLVGYGSNANKLRVWENVDWMVSPFDQKHLHQRLLSEIHQFPDPQQ